MTQPKDLPTWATDALYSLGPAAGLPVRVVPSAPAQGIVPGDPVYAQEMNALLGLALDHIAALAAAPALNWTVTRSYSTTAAGGVTAILSRDWIGTKPVIASGVDDNYAPRLVIQDSDNERTWSSADGAHWDSGDFAFGVDAYIAIAAFEGYPWFGGLTAAGASETSVTAGNAWAAGPALPSANDWQAMAADQHGSRVVAFGLGKGATAVVTGGVLGAWSALTLPGDWAGFGENCRQLYTPALADSASGFMVLPVGVRDWILWSADGVTWAQVTTPVTTQWYGATWSESRQRWYLVSGAGELAESVSADPTDGFTLLTAPFATDLTGIAYHGITSIGRFLLVFGANLSTVGGPRGGNMVVTDLDRWHTFSVDQGVWASGLAGSNTDDPTTAFTVPLRFDGHVVLARVRSIYDDSDTIDCAFSMRLPWELNG